MDHKGGSSLAILKQAIEICDLISKEPAESSLCQNLELREKLNSFCDLKMFYKDECNREWRLNELVIDEALYSISPFVKAKISERNIRNKLIDEVNNQIGKVASLRQGNASESEIANEEQILSEMKAKFKMTLGEEWNASMTPVIPVPTCLKCCPTGYLDVNLLINHDVYMKYRVKPLLLINDLKKEVGEFVPAVYMMPTFRKQYIVRCQYLGKKVMTQLKVTIKMRADGACEENISSAMTALSAAKESFKSYSGIQYPFVKGHVLPDFPTGCQKSLGNNVCLADITTFEGEESKLLTRVSPGVTVWKIKKASELTEDEKLYCPHITNLRDLLDE